MRAITFPKTGDGVWTNQETGVRVSKHYEGHYRILAGGLPKDPAVGVHCQYNTWTQALAAAKNYVATVARPAIAAAYVEAVDEHVERSAAMTADAGAATWRLDVARHAVICARSDKGSFWLSRALYEVRQVEEARWAIARWAIAAVAPGSAVAGRSGVDTAALDAKVAPEPLPAHLAGGATRTTDARDARAVTFPKAGDGVWINQETGVRISRTPECVYLVEWPFLEASPNSLNGYQGNGGWQLIDACVDLWEAIEMAKVGAEGMRGLIAKAYVEAVEEYVERVARLLTAAGARAWRIDRARHAAARAVKGLADDPPWLAAALRDARLAEERLIKAGPGDTSLSMDLWRSITGE